MSTQGLSTAWQSYLVIPHLDHAPSVLEERHDKEESPHRYNTRKVSEGEGDNRAYQEGVAADA